MCLYQVGLEIFKEQIQQLFQSLFSKVVNVSKFLLKFFAVEVLLKKTIAIILTKKRSALP
jgi:hypothetical protein